MGKYASATTNRSTYGDENLITPSNVFANQSVG